MASVKYDLGYLKETLESLESYLLSEELFWNLAANPPVGEPAYPALTLGGILLSKARLTAQRLDASDYAEFQTMSGKLDDIRRRWRTAWESKCQRSFKSRLTQWANFLEDYQKDPEVHASRYAYEVRLRVMLELLAAELPEIPPAQAQLLNSLDLILKHVLEENGLTWDEIYAGGFPREKYWYLYGKLKDDPKPR